MKGSLMSITLDPSVNSLIGQAQAMQSSSVHLAAQVSLTKDIQSSQENAIMTLLGSAAGLSTYNAQGQMQTVSPVGTHINVVG